MQVQSTKRPQPLSPRKRRFYAYTIASLFVFPLLCILVLSQTFNYAYTRAQPEQEYLTKEIGIKPFPVGVDPHNEVIAENPGVETYLSEHLLGTPSDTSGPFSLIQPILGKLALFSWYQNLASASTRILVIDAGERKEQVAQHFGKILGWSDDEKREFIATVVSTDPVSLEGKFVPGTYVVSPDTKPHEVAPLVTTRFSETILERYPSDVARVVPLEDALIIASLLEREAYDFEDMRYISGIIWNRLFIDMRLQIDATLQYAKGEQSKKTWWPKVVPNDKYIDSTYNTYKYEGLPPTPIANPSANAILAALNPRETDCIYYFHDKKAGFHCSTTYEEHVASLKEYYGRGK